VRETARPPHALVQALVGSSALGDSVRKRGDALTRVVLAGAILIAQVCAAHAANRYVDATVGNDRNSGATPTAPWKNCPGMSAYSGADVLHPGDTVYFNRNRTWMVSGPQGIFLTGGVKYVGNSWGSGTGKARVCADTDLDAGVVRFRDHPTYETVFEGFNVDGNGKVASGVDINHRYWTLMNGATKRVQDCEVHHLRSNQLLDQYKYGIIVSNFGGTAGYAENVEIINCVVHDTPRDAICLYPGDENRDCRIKNITVRGCEAYNTGQDPFFGAGAGILVKGYVQDAVIEYNYVHDTKGAIMFVNGNERRHYGVGPTNIHIRYNLFTGNTSHGAIRIYDGRSGKDPKDLKIYGNLVYNNSIRGGLFIGPDLGSTLRLLVYNNTFYNAPVVISENGATMTRFEFTNNIVQCDHGVPLTDSKGQITAHSNNIFYTPDAVLVRSKGVEYGLSNLAAGYESTTIGTRPLFADPNGWPTGFVRGSDGAMVPDRDGLSLEKGSPGLGAGVTLSDEFAGSINSVHRPSKGQWDLGAYQSPFEKFEQ
jgi:hypothetical protein